MMPSFGFLWEPLYGGHSDLNHQQRIPKIRGFVTVPFCWVFSILTHEMPGQRVHVFRQTTVFLFDMENLRIVMTWLIFVHWLSAIICLAWNLVHRSTKRSSSSWNKGGDWGTLRIPGKDWEKIRGITTSPLSILLKTHWTRLMGFWHWHFFGNKMKTWILKH